MNSTAQWTDEERRNVHVVEELLAAFVARDPKLIAAMFTDDAVFRMGAVGERPPSNKPDFAVLGNASRIAISVRKTFASGPIVMNDRDDCLVFPEQTISGRWIGIFAIRDGRVAEFIDYTIERHVRSQVASERTT